MSSLGPIGRLGYWMARARPSLPQPHSEERDQAGPAPRQAEENGERHSAGARPPARRLRLPGGAGDRPPRVLHRGARGPARARRR